MSYNNNYITTVSAYDEGLRNHMLQVYNYMTFALAISGLVSIGVSMSPVHGSRVKYTGYHVFRD